MKKILFVAMLLFGLILNITAQRESIYLKASDTIIFNKIIIPDDIYNNDYSLELNGKAFKNGYCEVKKIDSLIYNGFYVQRISVREILISLKGKKIFSQKKINNIGGKRIAWTSMLITSIFFLIFFYLFFIKEDKTSAVVLVVIAIIISAALSAVALVVALLVVAVVSLALSAIIVIGIKIKLIKMVFIFLSMLGMCIIWLKFNTPVFFISTIISVVFILLLFLFKKIKNK